MASYSLQISGFFFDLEWEVFPNAACLISLNWKGSLPFLCFVFISCTVSQETVSLETLMTFFSPRTLYHKAPPVGPEYVLQPPSFHLSSEASKDPLPPLTILAS